MIWIALCSLFENSLITQNLICIYILVFWKHSILSPSLISLPHLRETLQHTVEVSLIHLYLCWHVVSRWDTSGSYQMWAWHMASLKGKSINCVGIESPLWCYQWRCLTSTTTTCGSTLFFVSYVSIWFPMDLLAPSYFSHHKILDTQDMQQSTHITLLSHVGRFHDLGICQGPRTN